MNSDDMVFYLAGPMSGIPQFNFPAFEEAATKLRELAGMTIINPAELDDDEDRAAALASPDGDLKEVKHTWGEFLSRDVLILADQCDGIMFLPGWEHSKGACLEACVGLLLGYSFALCNTEEEMIYPLSPSTVAEKVIDRMYTNYLPKSMTVH